MAHLLRIIMINGHLQGVVELDLHGHSNICGTNASGKTTLQRLIPVFYGERPNSVVPRTRQKFDRYYLPHANSYLVYEYQRESGNICMAVLTRNYEEGVDYRFIHSAYASELFLEFDGQHYQARSYSDFARNLRINSIEHSYKLDSISDYRAVIQNDVGSLKLDRQSINKLRQLSLRYSLSENPHRLRHIEKLVSAVHAKEGKMDTLKTMLAAIFEEEGVALPVTRIKSTQVRDWIQQVHQSRRLQGLQQQFNTLDVQLKQREASAQLIADLTPLIRHDLSTLKQQQANTEQQLNQQTEQLKEYEQAYDEQRRESSHRLLDIKAELQQIDLTLTSLSDRFHAYEERDMPTLEQEVAQLGFWRDERDSLDEQLNLWREAEGSSRQRFEARRFALADELQEFRLKIDEQLEQVRKQEAILRDEQASKLRDLEAEYQSQLNTERERFNQQRLQLLEKKQDADLQLKGNLLTEDELEAVDAHLARTQAAQDQLNQLNDELDRLNLAHEHARQTRDTQLQKISVQRQSTQRAHEQYDQLRLQAEPKPNSLRAFLQAHKPGWQHSIGKVIHAELLERTDLSPALNETANASLYQLELDLSRILLPEHARDNEELERELKEALNALRQQQSLLEQLEQQQKSHNQACEDAEQHVNAARQKRNQARTALEFAQSAFEQLKLQHEQLKQERRRTLRDKQHELEQKLSQLDTRHSLLINERKDAFNIRKQEEMADVDMQLSLLKERFRQHEMNLQARQHSYNKQIKELEHALKQELIEQGIDPERVGLLERQLKELRARIRATEERSDELKEYREFIRVDWEQRKPALVAREYELKQQKLSYEEQLNQLETNFATQKKALKRLIEQLRDELLTLQQQQSVLLGLIKHIEQLAYLPDVDGSNSGLANTSAAERSARLQHALTEYNEQSLVFTKSVQEFERELIRDAAADFMDTWLYQRQQLGTEPQAHRLLQAFTGMLRLLEDQQQNLIHQGHSYGKDLHNFFTVFRDLNRRIHEQSRRLSAEVTEELELEDISKSEVHIRSTIDELSFWQPLKDFSALYEAWEKHPNELPAEAYLKQLGDVAELLRSDQQFTFESLLRLELHLREGSADLIIRNDRQLLESSSHGMAYLILCKYLLAFTRLLRGSAQVTIHWPIDEIGTLAYHNVEKLFNACTHNNIFIVGAFPNPESEVLSLFQQRYLIERAPGQPAQLKRIEPQPSRLSRLLHQQPEAISS